MAQLLVDASTLAITSIEITECEEGSFTLSMTSRIANTGPLPASLDAMTISMFAESPVPHGAPGSRVATIGAFASVRLPAVSVSPAGADCNVFRQRVTIKDASKFHIFNKNLINQSESPLYISGESTIRVFGGLCYTNVKLYKTVVLKGMEGLHITVLETRKDSRSLTAGSPDKIQVDVRIENKSCLAMDMGSVWVGIHHDGVVISRLQAALFLQARGTTEVTFRGRMNLGSLLRNPRVGLSFLSKDLAGDEVRAVVVGERGERTHWIDRVVKEMKSPIVMDSTLRDIYHSTK